MYRHEKEKIYFLLNAIMGGLIWCFSFMVTFTSYFAITALTFLFIPTLSAIWLFWIWGGLLFAVLLYFMGREFYKAQIFGNSVRVSESQYPELHKVVQEVAKELGIIEIPYVFVVNMEGGINAFALKFIGHSYVVLYASLVDLMLRRKAHKELRAIIAHEMAHHAAGHTSVLRNLLIEPALLLPIWGTLVGNAYRRGCELTADRVAMILCGDIEATTRALVSIAGGADSLANQTNVQVFMHQEMEIISFFAFINDVFSSHPRITKRVILLEAFGKTIGLPAKSALANQWVLYGVSGPLAGKAVELGMEPLAIGRDARMSNLIVPGDSGVISKRHCLLKFDSLKQGFVLEDCGSTNGTFLASGQRLTPGAPFPLKPGDRFYLAEPEIAFELRIR